jgi:hypothetical protein
MENDSSSGWDVPRPAVRLWLTLALGILGALLFPCKMEFFVHAFANVKDVTALAWMTAAFAGVLLLHRAEKVKVPWRMAVLMGLALALCLVLPPRSGEEESVFWARFVWLCCVGTLLMTAGASASGLQFRRGSIRPWVECLVRGPAIAVAAPLLLFASRPIDGRRSSSPMPATSRGAFAAFPCVLAASGPVPFALDIFGVTDGYSRLTLSWYSFGIWMWLGCALLFLLSPWPEYPRIPKPGERPRPRTVHHLAVAAVVVMALLILSERGLSRFLWGVIWSASTQSFLWAWLGLALLLMLSPWPGYPRLPKLDTLPRARSAGPLGTAVFLALPLVPLAAIAYYPVLFILGGHLFSLSSNRLLVGSALDQSTIGKALFWFTISTATVIPYVAVARWMGDRSTRLGHWAFAVPTAVLFLCLLSILTIPFHALIQYIATMGFTPSRIRGVIYCLCGFAAVLGCGVAWLDFIPSGYRYRLFLHHQGYEWATSQDARRILRHLRWSAYRVPPSSDVEILPGSGPNAESLIAFMRMLARHRSEVRRRP